MAEPSYKIGEIAINYKDSGIIFNIFLIYKKYCKNSGIFKSQAYFYRRKIEKQIIK